MTTMTMLEAVQAVDPQAVERARRLLYAATLLSQGHARPEVSGMVRRRYDVHPSTAWRLVNIAADLAEEPQQQEAHP